MAAKTKDNVVILGRKNLPDGGVLIIPNFLSFHDLLLLEAELSDRGITYLIEEDALFDPLLQAHLEKDGVAALEFVVGDSHIETFKRQVNANVAAGEIVVFVPGLAATRPNSHLGVPNGILSYLVKSGAPIMPVYVDHPDDARLSIESAPPRQTIVFSFGRMMEREAANLANYQETLLLAGKAAFENRSNLEMSLPWAVLQGLKKHGSANRMTDGLTGEELKFDRMLGAAIVLSKYIKQQTSKKRVGIVLPPGRGGLLANIAVLFAGKTPVNLNFTAGEAAIRSSLEQADIDRLITADPFVRRQQRFPWPPTKQLILLERIVPPMKAKMAFWTIAAKFLSAGSLANMLGISKKGGDEEAVLLFTSGSSGEPKGVVLSHQNVMANVHQFSSRLQLKSDDSVLGCLPLFHSFGCTVTMWFPLIEGVNLVTYISPMEVDKLAALTEKHRISLLLATPTFLRGWNRKAKKEQLASVNYVVTGAEKLPAKVSEAFEKKFGLPVLEGYGLTETSPATNVNLPDPIPEGDRIPVIASHRPGSVGQLLPGMAIRITDPDTDEPRSLHKSGMIWLSGANVFNGYLNQPEKTKKILVNGWLNTGDIGRLDEDLFLYIEGRLSRFSKIAGEMVPHETVEETLNKELGFDTETDRKLVVMGLPDEAKGETLVLLSTVDGLDVTDLRYRLLEAGIPSLWIPKTIIKVQDIPMLASGKLDIKNCLRIAEQGEDD